MNVFILTSIIASITFYLGFYYGVRNSAFTAFKFAKKRSNTTIYREGFEAGLRASKLVDKIKVALEATEEEQ